MNISTVSPSRKRRRASAVVSCAMVLVLAACGGGSDDSSDVADEASTTLDAASPDSQAIDTVAAPEPATVETVAIDESTEPQSVLQQNGPISTTGAPLPPFDSTITDDAIGTQSPTVEGESFDGTPITVGAPTDGPTMIVFLAHWCPHCNTEIPVLVGLQDDLPAELNVVGVSTAVAEDRDNFPPSEWTEAQNWPWPMMADDVDLTAIGTLGGTGFPYTVILDSDGTVLARRGGEATAEETLAFVNDALASR